MPKYSKREAERMGTDREGNPLGASNVERTLNGGGNMDVYDPLKARTKIGEELGISDLRGSATESLQALADARNQARETQTFLGNRPVSIQSIRGQQASAARLDADQLAQLGESAKLAQGQLQMGLQEQEAQFGVVQRDMQQKQQLMYQFPGAGISLQDDPQTAAKKIAAYQQNQQRQQFQQQMALKNAGTQQDLNKPLSISEAQQLGVPFGTTYGEARQMGIVPSAQQKPLTVTEQLKQQEQNKQTQQAIRGSLSTAQQAQDLLNHPGLSASVGLKGPSVLLPGTKAADFIAQLDTLSAGLSLEQVQRLTGAISDKDLEVATKAGSTLSRSQSERQFKKNLHKIAGVQNAAAAFQSLDSNIPITLRIPAQIIDGQEIQEQQLFIDPSVGYDDKSIGELIMQFNARVQ